MQNQREPYKGRLDLDWPNFAPLLNSYMNRIDDKIENRYPDCSAQGHDTRHLFNCKMKKTTLNVESLWRDPVAAANFLKNLTRTTFPSNWLQQQKKAQV